jgi:hypothetical protein
MKIVFLHIPKTAGQSVHTFLTRYFPKEEICPARENFQLLPISLPRRRMYRLFSGHLDWAQLDGIGYPRFIFTVLREPTERLLSFYFFLRQKAATIDPKILTRPEHAGLRAAITLAPDEYFCGAPPQIRTFIDGLYDNFYSYYFAGRTFDAWAKLNGVTKRHDSKFSTTDLVDMAIENLNCLDRVYTVETLNELERDIEMVLGSKRIGRSLTKLRVNVGKSTYEARIAELRALGATQRTFDRLTEMTQLDAKIWARFS